MGSKAPTLLWLRRDLRLSDHAALHAALARGGPVIPVFICDASVRSLGAAPKWRLGLSLEQLALDLEKVGSRLVYRSGDALDVLKSLSERTGADAVYWSRLYDPNSIARDTEVKTALAANGVDAKSFAGHVLHEPWTVQTRTGGFYRVYTPMWREVRGREVASTLPAPDHLPAPESWPDSEDLSAWDLGEGMRRGASIVAPYQSVGEQAAQQKLVRFVSSDIASYSVARDFPGQSGCSELSENLALGEISVAQCWHAGQRALEDGQPGAEAWLKQLVWRDFAWHLTYHTPHILDRSWREGWDRFPWNKDENTPEVIAWKQGRTGITLVDAAMRELYVTGKMHNRARMIVGSYLTKHLMSDWRIGLRWFENCLTDWDPANNAMGWQWVAGSGPDAAPYFRVFNPDGQAEKFDGDATYRKRWIAEGAAQPSQTALSYFDAIPRSWGLDPNDPYPKPVVALAEGRQRALAAYQARDF